MTKQDKKYLKYGTLAALTAACGLWFLRRKQTIPIITPSTLKWLDPNA